MEPCALNPPVPHFFEAISPSTQLSLVLGCQRFFPRCGAGKQKPGRMFALIVTRRQVLTATRLPPCHTPTPTPQQQAPAVHSCTGKPPCKRAPACCCISSFYLKLFQFTGCTLSRRRADELKDPAAIGGLEVGVDTLQSCRSVSGV